MKQTTPSAVDLIKLDEKDKLELRCLARGLDVCECARFGSNFLHPAESRIFNAHMGSLALWSSLHSPYCEAAIDGSAGMALS